MFSTLLPKSIEVNQSLSLGYSTAWLQILLLKNMWITKHSKLPKKMKCCKMFNSIGAPRLLEYLV